MQHSLLPSSDNQQHLQRLSPTIVVKSSLRRELRELLYVRGIKEKSTLKIFSAIHRSARVPKEHLLAISQVTHTSSNAFPVVVAEAKSIPAAIDTWLELYRNDELMMRNFNNLTEFALSFNDDNNRTTDAKSLSEWYPQRGQHQLSQADSQQSLIGIHDLLKQIVGVTADEIIDAAEISNQRLLKTRREQRLKTLEDSELLTESLNSRLDFTRQVLLNNGRISLETITKLCPEFKSKIEVLKATFSDHLLLGDYVSSIVFYDNPVAVLEKIDSCLNKNLVPRYDGPRALEMHLSSYRERGLSQNSMMGLYFRERVLIGKDEPIWG